MLKGDFYSNEITKIANQDFHKIAAVLKQKDNKSFVKWQGYPDRFNSWVKNSDIQKLNWSVYKDWKGIKEKKEAGRSF